MQNFEESKLHFPRKALVEALTVERVITVGVWTFLIEITGAVALI